MTITHNKLTKRQLFAYSVAETPMSMAATPVSLFLPALYTQDLGFGMASVGFILMMSRFWDVITDPVIGYFSDRTRSRIGRRKPWLIIAVPIIMISVYHLFMPPEDVDQLYLLGWIMLIWLGWTLFNIPYFAWGAELSTGYTERTRITGWRTVAGLAGTLMAIGIPAASELLFGWGGMNREIMFIIGTTVLILMPLMVFPAIAVVPERQDLVPAQMHIIKGLKIMWSNGPFRRLLFAFISSSLAIALCTPLFVMFVTHVTLDPAGAPKVVLGYFLGNLVAVPFWVWLAARTEKHITWLFSITLMGLMFTQFYWLGPGDLWLATLLLFIVGIGGGNTSVVPTSMKADVIDLDSLESGEDRAGLFFAAWSTATKLVGALGVGISLPVLAWLGFDPAVTNSPEKLDILRKWFSFAPVPLYLLSAILIWGYPINRKRHAEIRATLEARRGANEEAPSASNADQVSIGLATGHPRTDQ